MDYHLDRSIRFAREDEYKSLYQWSLQEFTAEGQAAGEKQIPWMWTLSFAASEMRLAHRFEATVDLSSKPREQTSSETIQLTLTPDRRHNDYATTRFSMFGTNRDIKSFSLTVQCIEDVHQPQRCSVWGTPSYTAESDEIDFRNDTQDDVVDFNLSLSKTNFDSLRHAAQHGQGEYSVLLSVSRVHGFYSEWSPGISTNRVKVLAAGGAQAIALPEGVGELPRLGDVGEFRLHVVRRSTLTPLYPREDEKVADEAGDAPEVVDDSARAADPNDTATKVLAGISRMHKSVAELRLPIWLLLFVGIAILIFHK